ncbi:MAG: cupin domain-containing protein [Exilibacterium sp.]
MKTTTSWDNKPLPAYPTTQPEISILRITIPPLTALPEHQHPIINTGVLISGNLEAVSEHGDTLSLHAGDTIAEVVNTWHYGRNPSDDEPAVIIVVYVGTPGTPLTIKRDGTMRHEE